MRRVISPALAAALLVSGITAAPAAPQRHAAARPAGPALRLQSEAHDGYTRLIFPARGRNFYTVTSAADRAVITYPAVKAVTAPAEPLRNVVGVTAEATQTSVQVAPGARMLIQTVGSLLVIDILDPPPPAPAPPPPPPTVAQTAPTVSVAKEELPPTTPGAPPPPLPATTLPPPPVVIQRIGAAPQPGILLPAGSQVGAASFRLGRDMVVVLDTPIPFDTAQLAGDPVFGHASVERTDAATVLRIPLMAPASLRLTHMAGGWAATAIAAPAPVLGIAPRLVPEGRTSTRLQLPLAQPGRSVTVVDRATGSFVLVGTQTGTGQGVASRRDLVQLSLLPTVQGLAIDPHSDDIALQRDPDGFSVAAGGHAGGAIIATMPAVTPATSADTQLSRLFELPDLDIPALRTRLANAMSAASAAPALGRGLPRRQVAEAMVALGMGVEAQAVMEIAVADDPDLSRRPGTKVLRAVAAFLAGRLDDAHPLADPALSNTSEAILWRGLLAAEEDETSSEAARLLKTGMPLLLSYPAPLRERFLPMALQTMALGGQARAAKDILAKLPKDDPSLELARGMTQEMLGDADAALKSYADVAGRSDRLPRWKAMVRSVNLRLARHAIGPGEAADALERALYAWREPKDELALRIHIADLRRQTGQWREASTLLREARAIMPEMQTQIDGELGGMLTNLLEGDAANRMPAAEFVALYDDNADLLRQAPWTEAAGTALVNRLVALDLPARADPVLVQMIATATDPAKRAFLGTRLASVRLSADDPGGALAALSDTRPPAGVTLDPDVVQTRQLLYARAEAARGNKDTALNMLAGQQSAAANDLRASLLVQRKDWPNAVVALTAVESRRLPPDGDTLSPEQQAIVMRLASAATMAGDQATIDRLRTTRGAAMAKGSSAEAFRLLVSQPVTKTADLPRAFDEIRIARDLEQKLAAPARP